MHNPKCFSRHLGPWAIEPVRFVSMVALAKAGKLQAITVADGSENDGPLYLKDGTGIAIIPVEGAIMKEQSKFGGASSLDIRRGLRAAVADPDIKSILLAIDSPGGTVAGMTELADAVKAADLRKPVYSQINDLGASAAYWAASQARSISANATAQVGSIGVLAIVEDTSKMYEMAGITVHVVSTGEYKGAFADGTEVTEAQLADLQSIVDETNKFFLGAVALGRGMSMDAVKEVADGRMYMASQAQALGLVDHVRSMDETLDAIRADMARDASRASVARRMDASKRRAVHEALDIA